MYNFQHYIYYIIWIIYIIRYHPPATACHLHQHRHQDRHGPESHVSCHGQGHQCQHLVDIDDNIMTGCLRHFILTFSSGLSVSFLRFILTSELSTAKQDVEKTPKWTNHLNLNKTHSRPKARQPWWWWWWCRGHEWTGGMCPAWQRGQEETREDTRASLDNYNCDLYRFGFSQLSLLHLDIHIVEL